MTVSSFLIKALVASSLVFQATARPVASEHRTFTPSAIATKVPAAASIVPSAATKAVSSATVSRSAQASGPTTSSNVSTSGSGSRKIQYGGVNIAGFDFGCSNTGTCTQGGQVTTMAEGQGLAQMKHFVSKGLNTFRLPVGWQYLTGFRTPSELDATNFATYDKLVQACLSSGAALCIVDLHNYARWNGQIIGQGGPSNQMFAKFWALLAAKYAGNSKIAFDIMNEPHDLDVPTWRDTAQAVVNAIRAAGANNIILLSGTNFASAAAFPSSGNGNLMLQVHNPNGGYDNIVLSVHQYLDSDFSGTSAECSQGAQAVTGFNNLAKFLRSNGNRKAMILETGGGNTQSCMTQLCQALDAVNANADVFMGVTTWSAGAFSASYELAETPSGSGSSMTDTSIVQSCVIPKLGAK